MKRGRYIWDRAKRDWVAFDKWRGRPRSGLVVVSDIEPYRNVIDGKPVGGRRQHREFLKRHDVIEVGNEPQRRTIRELESPGRDIARAIEQLSNGDRRHG